MTLDELLAELKTLSKKWQREADNQRNEWYGDEASIDRFTEELDELIERAKPGGEQP